MYSITYGTKNTKSYIVALEDKFGWVPLFEYNDFDSALRVLALVNRDQMVWSDASQSLIDRV